MEIWILLLIVAAVAGAFIIRGVRSGLTGSPYPPDDQPSSPVNNSLTNWMAYNTMQQVDSTPASDAPTTDASSFSGNDSGSDSAPQSDYSDQSGAGSDASDPTASGYDPSSSGGSDGGGFGGGGGDSF